MNVKSAVISYFLGLGKVTDFSLVELDDKAGSALVSWSPVDSADVLAGYLLYYRSLPVPGQKICPLVLEEYELRLNAVRAHIFPVLFCNINYPCLKISSRDAANSELF